MHADDAHGLPYFISSSGVLQFREVCYTVVLYVPYVLLATFWVTIFVFFHPGPQPISESIAKLERKKRYMSQNQDKTWFTHL